MFVAPKVLRRAQFGEGMLTIVLWQLSMLVFALLRLLKPSAGLEVEAVRARKRQRLHRPEIDPRKLNGKLFVRSRLVNMLTFPSRRGSCLMGCLPKTDNNTAGLG